MATLRRPHCALIRTPNDGVCFGHAQSARRRSAFYAVPVHLLAMSLRRCGDACDRTARISAFPEVIKLFSCSTQLSMNFVLLINLKLLTTANSFLLNIAEHENFSANKYENANLNWYFSSPEQSLVSYSDGPVLRRPSSVVCQQLISPPKPLGQFGPNFTRMILVRY